MKLSKRIISLVFAVMLISAFAIQAAAATDSYIGGRMNNCLFSCFTTCRADTETCNLVIEGDPIGGTAPEDHQLRADMTVHYEQGPAIMKHKYPGTASYTVAVHNRTVSGLVGVDAYYLINGIQAYHVLVHAT